MVRLQTKRSVSRREIQRISEELLAMSMAADFLPQHEERLEEIVDEVKVLTRELKEEEALNEPHIKTDILIEDSKSVSEFQGALTRRRTLI